VLLRTGAPPHLNLPPVTWACTLQLPEGQIMSDKSTRLALPYIQPAQAQKHVTH